MFPFFAAINFGSGKRQGRPYSKTLPRHPRAACASACFLTANGREATRIKRSIRMGYCIRVHSRLLKNASGTCCSCLLWLPPNPLCHPAQFHCFCRRTKNVPPLQGLVCFYRLFPGRCPGLSHVAPSGLYRGCHLSFQKIKSSPRRGILPGGLFGFAGSRVA